MKFKAVLLLCLLLFVSFSTIALASLNTILNNLKPAAFAIGLGSAQPCGGDPVDNPVSPN
jgi:hypothetical protein